MTPRPKADRATKRAELAEAAARAFAAHGVSKTSVSDIVKEAGVAQGTFYLYFESKDDVVLAIVERMVEQLVVAIEAALASSQSSAVDKFRLLTDSLSTMEGEAGVQEVSHFLHRKENRALHDRLTEHLAERMADVVEEIIAEGIAEGSFHVTDARSAAWFVLGGLQSVEARGLHGSKMRAALHEASDLALRSLGYEEVSS